MNKLSKQLKKEGASQYQTDVLNLFMRFDFLKKKFSNDKVNEKMLEFEPRKKTNMERMQK